VNRDKLENYLRKINIHYSINYSLADLTTFKIGGPARLYILPETQDELIRVFSFCMEKKIPFFILGGGSNILVADEGLKSAVIHTQKIKKIKRDGNSIYAAAGVPMSDLTEYAAQNGLGGIDNFYSMPGTVGGAVWINARCYGINISNKLKYVDIMDETLKVKRLLIDEKSFGYKNSPFQKRRVVILGAAFELYEDSKERLLEKMDRYKRDREAKGHFLYPCAGSVFKNNPVFGRPSGEIVDSLGFKGFSIGDACILEHHANIIVNKGKAKAKEVKKIISTVKKKVKETYGIELEEEILFIDDKRKEAGNG
jgi:UDP-N-acetylmuramate dehydrogenase